MTIYSYDIKKANKTVLLRHISREKTIRGRSQTTWTDFSPILTTYLPIVDFRGHLVYYLPLVHVDIEKLDHLPFTTFTEQKKMRL